MLISVVHVSEGDASFASGIELSGVKLFPLFLSFFCLVCSLALYAAAARLQVQLTLYL